jgi:hypothetical protein
MNLKDFVCQILASSWPIIPTQQTKYRTTSPSGSTSIFVNLCNYWYKFPWFFKTPLLDVEGFPFYLVNKVDVSKPFLFKTSSTPFACLVPSIWFFKFPSRFFFGGYSWKKSLQKVHFTLYQNDFNFADFGSPIKTIGYSFVTSGALTNSIIHAFCNNLLMVFICE